MRQDAGGEETFDQQEVRRRVSIANAHNLSITQTQTRERGGLSVEKLKDDEGKRGDITSALG